MPETTPPIPTNPGIYEGLPYEVYAEIEAVSATRLKHVHESPLVYAHHKAGGTVVSDAMRGGHAIHTATLEPELFDDEFAIWLKASGKRASKKWDRFEAAAAAEGREIITEAQSDAALDIAKAVRRHPVAGPYVEEPGVAEVSVIWVEPNTGTKCKVRIDYAATSALLELKSTRDHRWPHFRNDSARRGYHIQLAFYAAGWEAAANEILPVKVVAVQTPAPHDVVCYNALPELLIEGEVQYLAALDTLAECEQSGIWPGVAYGGEVDLGLPEWAYSDETKNKPITFGEMEF